MKKGSVYAVLLSLFILRLLSFFKVSELFPAKQGRDYFVYLNQANAGLFSGEMFFGFKPFAVPLIYSPIVKYFGYSEEIYSQIFAYQFVISSIAWTLLAFGLSLFFQGPKRKMAVMVFVFLVSTLYMGIDRAVFSESLNTSLFVYFLAFQLIFIKYRSPTVLTLLIVSSVLFGFCRFANAYIVAASAGLFVISIIVRSILNQRLEEKKQALDIKKEWLIIFSFLVIFLTGSYMGKQPLQYEKNGIAKKVEVPPIPSIQMVYFSDFFFRLILTDEKLKTYFIESGMPINEHVEYFTDRTCCIEGWRWFKSPDTRETFNWLTDNGTKTYISYYLKHPMRLHQKTHSVHREIINKGRVFPSFIDQYLNRKKIVSYKSGYTGLTLSNFLSILNGSKYPAAVIFLSLISFFYNLMVFLKFQKPNSTHLGLASLSLVTVLTLVLHVIMNSIASAYPSLHSWTPSFHLHMAGVITLLSGLSTLSFEWDSWRQNQQIS